MPNLVRCTAKRYHVKRITDGAYADLRVQADKSVQLLLVCNVRDAYTTVERARAQQIAALLDVAAYPTFGKIIIEEAWESSLVRECDSALVGKAVTV